MARRAVINRVESQASQDMISKLFNLPAVYRSFHTLISGAKITHLRRHLLSLALDRPIRVIDLGCGPGTNAGLFADKNRYIYLGIDISSSYIRQATKKYALDFECADVTKLSHRKGKFDIVLINSVMHHLSPDDAKQVLKSAAGLLDAGGECLVLDMVRDRDRKMGSIVQRALIHLDRGRYCRTVDQLMAELSEHLRIARVQTFNIRLFGILLWDLRLLVARNEGESQATQVIAHSRTLGANT